MMISEVYRTYLLESLMLQKRMQDILDGKVQSIC